MRTRSERYIFKFFGLLVISMLSSQAVADWTCPQGHSCVPAKATPWNYYVEGFYKLGLFTSFEGAAEAYISYLNSNNWYLSAPEIGTAQTSITPLLPMYFTEPGPYGMLTDENWGVVVYQRFSFPYTCQNCWNPMTWKTETISSTGYANEIGSRQIYCETGYSLQYTAPTPTCMGGQSASLKITSPTNAEADGVTPETNYVSRISTFNTNVVPTPSINWSLALSYQTSKGKGALNDDLQFTSSAGVPMPQQLFASEGGKISVNASAFVNGTEQTATMTYYLVGNAIPNDLITNRLITLYGGATPRLLTGIAQVESTYHQFTKRTLFNIAALWPTESYDGGSHVGLMQMPVSYNPKYAWDWLLNTQDGSNLFKQKLRVAVALESRIRKKHPKLRALSAVELENMALTLYGPFAKPGLQNQYYIAVSSKGGPTWQINTANALGVKYADKVRANIQ